MFNFISLKNEGQSFKDIEQASPDDLGDLSPKEKDETGKEFKYS